MAKAKTTSRVVGKAKSTAVANWRDELAASAKAAVASEETAGTGGGRFFNLRAGQLSFDDAALPGNQMACVIVDSIFETVYYESDFDPENPSPPTAFAFGRDQAEMRWNEEYSDPEFAGKLCSESEVCEWGSAEKGKGKAAKELRRLAIVPAGTYKPLGKGGGFDLDLFDDTEPFRTADLAYLKLPVTSVKGFSQYLKQVAEQFDRPLWGVVTRVYLEPHPKYQFQVKCELLEVIEDEEILEALYLRHKEAEKAIDFPYIPRSDDDDNGGGQKTASRSAGKLSKRGGAAKGSSARRR